MSQFDLGGPDILDDAPRYSRGLTLFYLIWAIVVFGFVAWVVLTL